MNKQHVNFATGVIVAILAVVAMGAALAPDAIWNAVFDSTNSAIKIISVQDTFSANVDIGGTLAVTGATSLDGGLTMDSTAFTVANTSGNVATTGTLTVGGTAALNNGITVDSTAFTVANTSGNTAVAGTLTVTGATALNGGITSDSTAFTVADTSGNVATTGTLTVDGASSLKGAVVINEDSADVDTRIESNDVSDALKIDAGLNTIMHGTWDAYDYVFTTAQSYSLASTGRAGYVVQTVGAAGTFHLMTELLTSPGPGTVVTVKTGDTNDITIDTEGAETIDGAATYVLDGALEAVTLINNGTNWFVVGGYLE